MRSFSFCKFSGTGGAKAALSPPQDGKLSSFSSGTGKKEFFSAINKRSEDGLQLSSSRSDSFTSFRNPIETWSPETKNTIANAVAEKIQTLKAKIQILMALGAEADQARLSRLQKDHDDWAGGLTILNHHLKKPSEPLSVGTVKHSSTDSAVVVTSRPSSNAKVSNDSGRVGTKSKGFNLFRKTPVSLEEQVNQLNRKSKAAKSCKDIDQCGKEGLGFVGQLILQIQLEEAGSMSKATSALEKQKNVLLTSLYELKNRRSEQYGEAPIPQRVSTFRRVKSLKLVRRP